MLSTNIKRVTEKWGIPQKEAAKLFTNVNRGKLSSYCTGVSEPPILFMIELEEMTGISIKRIYMEELTLSEIPSKPFERQEASPSIGKSEKIDSIGYLNHRINRIEKRLKSLEQIEKFINKIKE